MLQQYLYKAIVRLCTIYDESGYSVPLESSGILQSSDKQVPRHEYSEEIPQQSCKPPNDRICAFATMLLEVQDALAGTDHTISDDDLYQWLFMNLLDIDIWLAATQAVIFFSLTFVETVQYFMYIEEDREESSGTGNDVKREGQRHREGKRLNNEAKVERQWGRANVFPHLL